MGFVLSSAFQGDYAAHGIGSILIHRYLATNKPLPNDDKELARIAGCTIEQWQNVSRRVRTLFYVADDGLLHQEELDGMLQEAVEFLTMKREFGARGGKATAERKVVPFAKKEAVE
jgi:uncharacterized protein YdaU (DUF1376 family)